MTDLTNFSKELSILSNICNSEDLISIVCLFCSIKTFKYAKEVKAEVIELKEDFKDLKDNLPLLGVDCDEITSLIKKVCTRVTGYGTPAYKDKSLRGRVYADIYGQVKREFQVKSYKAIKRSQAEKAKEIIRDYKAPTALLDEIIRVNNQINFKDVV